MPGLTFRIGELIGIELHAVAKVRVFKEMGETDEWVHIKEITLGFMENLCLVPLHKIIRLVKEIAMHKKLPTTEMAVCLSAPDVSEEV